MTKKTILLILVLVAVVVTVYFLRDMINVRDFFSFGDFSVLTESAELASPSGQISTKKGFGKILGEMSK